MSRDMKEERAGATWTLGERAAGTACAKALRQEVLSIFVLEEQQGASMAGGEWEGQRNIKIRSREVSYTMQGLTGWRTSLMGIMASVQTLEACGLSLLQQQPCQNPKKRTFS